MSVDAHDWTFKLAVRVRSDPCDIPFVVDRGGIGYESVG